MCRRGGHRYWANCGGLQTGEALPVPRAPFAPPGEARVISLVDLAAIVAAAALGAKKVCASFESALPQTLRKLPLPVRRFAVVD